MTASSRFVLARTAEDIFETVIRQHMFFRVDRGRRVEALRLETLRGTTGSKRYTYLVFMLCIHLRICYRLFEYTRLRAAAIYLNL